MIDVGVEMDQDGVLCGDVDVEDVQKIAGMLSPSPGGVGSVTASVLAQQLLKAAKR